MIRQDDLKRFICLDCGCELTKVNWIKAKKCRNHRLCDTCFRLRNRLKTARLRIKHSKELVEAKCNLYNITSADYNKMFDEQQGCCVICGRHQSELKKSLAIDHNHKTGKVRGLLCTGCNWSLGHLENNLEKINEYLKKG